MEYYNYCIKPYLSLHFSYDKDISVPFVEIPAKYIIDNDYLLSDEFKDWCHKQVNSIHIHDTPNDYFCSIHLLQENNKENVIVGKSSKSFYSAVDNMLEILKPYV